MFAVCEVHFFDAAEVVEHFEDKDSKAVDMLMADETVNVDKDGVVMQEVPIANTDYFAL